MTARPTPLKATRFDSWDALKLLGLLLVAVDHCGVFFYPHELWLRAIGRGAAPVFLFLTGYAPHYRFKWNIVWLAAILVLADGLMRYLLPMNILVTIIISRAIFNYFDARKKFIPQPYEWIIACTGLVATTYFLQYGSLGFLFALMGYMQRRPEHYPHEQRLRFALILFIGYGVLTAWSAHYSGLDILLMTASLAMVARLLWQFRVHEYALNSALLEQTAKWIARHSGYIFVAHLILLDWLTR